MSAMPVTHTIYHYAQDETHRFWHVSERHGGLTRPLTTSEQADVGCWSETGTAPAWADVVELPEPTVKTTQTGTTCWDWPGYFEMRLQPDPRRSVR